MVSANKKRRFGAAVKLNVVEYAEQWQCAHTRPSPIVPALNLYPQLHNVQKIVPAGTIPRNTLGNNKYVGGYYTCTSMSYFCTCCLPLNFSVNSNVNLPHTNKKLLSNTIKDTSSITHNPTLHIKTKGCAGLGWCHS